VSTKTESSRPVSLEPLLSILEAAAALTVCRTTVIRMIAAKRLRSIRIGRAVRVPESAITDFINGGGTRIIDEPIGADELKQAND
jgi:excisionase family DNA binding protein